MDGVDLLQSLGKAVGLILHFEVLDWGVGYINLGQLSWYLCEVINSPSLRRKHNSRLRGIRYENVCRNIREFEIGAIAKPDERPWLVFDSLPNADQ